MAEVAQGTRAIVASASRPSLPRHIKLQHDERRGRWVILAPERVFHPDDTAVAVLKLCDGARTVDAIAKELAAVYAAPVEHICADVVAMLQELTDKGVVIL